MKKRNYLSLLVAGAMCAGLILSGCSSEGGKKPADSAPPAPQVSTSPEAEDPDQVAADNVAALIDAIYVQQRTEDTDAQCTAAKEAWDALTDAQKELVSGEFADPDYFGRDTGDASLDDPRNQDDIGENELLVVSFGTSHTAKVSYSQMQAQMGELGYDNVFIGTVEGEPEETACEAVIQAVADAGYTKVVLRPLMVVAGDHANNDMAGPDADSWLSMFEASGSFDQVDTQIAGLGQIEAIQQLYVAHTAAIIGQ